MDITSFYTIFSNITLLPTVLTENGVRDCVTSIVSESDSHDLKGNDMYLKIPVMISSMAPS